MLKHCGFCALLEIWWSAVSTSPLIDLQSAFVFRFLVIFCLSLYKRKLGSWALFHSPLVKYIWKPVLFVGYYSRASVAAFQIALGWHLSSFGFRSTHICWEVFLLVLYAACFSPTQVILSCLVLSVFCLLGGLVWWVHESSNLLHLCCHIFPVLLRSNKNVLLNKHSIAEHL